MPNVFLTDLSYLGPLMLSYEHKIETLEQMVQLKILYITKKLQKIIVWTIS